jgi:hypothetical protein
VQNASWIVSRTPSNVGAREGVCHHPRTVQCPLGTALATASACAVLAACGGGSSPAATTAAAASSPASGLSDQTRIDAATATAQSDTNACAPIRPFYWEIGDRSSTLASGSVASSASTTVYTRASLMSIASASKWLYASYVAERRGGALGPDDYRYLNFESGYTSFDSCDQNQTVAECQAMGTNADYTAANDGKFFYNGGHMQAHAVLLGLGSLDNAGLASELKSQLAPDGALIYTQPQLAGGVFTSSAAYASVLRKMLGGQLRMGALLGTHPVCTNPRTCASAVSAPIPSSESWHYSIGHWVEDDPKVGDGAFSSAGLFGFYPWIDASKTWYGIIARVAVAGALDSVDCGRLVRKAWTTGQPQ